MATGDPIEVSCIYREACTDVGICCLTCQNNTGRRSYFVPIQSYPKAGEPVLCDTTTTISGDNITYT